MKRKIVLAVSLLAGIIAALMARFYIAAKDAEVKALKDSIASRYGEIRVVVFNRDLPAGTVLQQGDLGSLAVPALGLRGQAVPEEEWRSVIGRKILLGHKKRDVLFWADIEGGDPQLTGLSSDIKKTMRAISINCSGASAVSSMVKPNDHVDVIATFDLGSKGTSSKDRNLVTCTILQNVLVLATGQRTAKSRSKDFANLSGYATVTLEVTPREAEMLAFAEQIKGRLVLTLRNRNDVSYEKELPKVDFEKIHSEIEELNARRQQLKLINR
ncbi:MAG: Flp pilus assembly protein CpaB [Kiritimatiellae bacterium]|nr:Flp pilus assembly protein CpaB [Kiritimatiellia bacterium]